MQVVMPLDLGMRIEANDKVRTLIMVTERMDYSALTKSYQRQPRRGEATPKQMFQIVLLGFLLGRYTTRGIESACKNDIRFLYLLNGKRVPDHSTIARFIREHLGSDVAEDLFYQLVLLLKEQGEIAFENLFVDGTKIEANASRYSFVWKKAISKYEARADEKLAGLQERLLTAYGLVCESPADCHTALQEMQKEKNIAFVHGRGKRKTQLQRDTEELEELMAQKAKYAAYNKTFKGRGSFSKTDPDATFMRMKEDHMRNSQLKAAYNLQLGVEGAYIVGVHVCAHRSDAPALGELQTRMDARLKAIYKNVSADAGYEGEQTYVELARRGQLAYFTPQNYTLAKSKKHRNNPYHLDNMPYDEGQDSYTCPAGHTFHRKTEYRRKNKSGYESTVTLYECDGCENCPQKPQCTKAKGNRQITISKAFKALRQADVARISTDFGKTLRMNRSIQVEGAFGVLKADWGLRRFLRRGEANVFTEMLLYAMAYNVSKLHNKMSRNQQGCTLHRLNSA